MKHKLFHPPQMLIHLALWGWSLVIVSVLLFSMVIQIVTEDWSLSSVFVSLVCTGFIPVYIYKIYEIIRYRKSIQHHSKPLRFLFQYACCLPLAILTGYILYTLYSNTIEIYNFSAALISLIIYIILLFLNSLKGENKNE